MNSEEFLRRIAEIRVWRQDGQRAPHKPLLLLLALGRLSQGKPRLASYTHEIRQPLSRLLDRFGPPRKATHAEHPFWRLRGDGLWEVPGDESLPTTSSGDVLSSALVENQTHGGFPEPLQQLLRRTPELVETAAAHLLVANFPDSLHLPIRDEVGLQAGMVLEQFPTMKPLPQRRRDPNFRPAVLTAYERRCAICDFDVRLAEDLLGLDAAHIKWHAVGGPDKVQTGWRSANSTTTRSTGEPSGSLRPEISASSCSYPRNSAGRAKHSGNSWTRGDSLSECRRSVRRSRTERLWTGTAGKSSGASPAVRELGGILTAAGSFREGPNPIVLTRRSGPGVTQATANGSSALTRASMRRDLFMSGQDRSVRHHRRCRGRARRSD